MKGLVFNGPRDVRYESYDDPKLATPNSAILKVRLCSICGSDLHIYHGAHIGAQAYTEDSPRFCVGHEFAGEVVEVGPDVHGFQVGDEVFAAGGTGCGSCVACRTNDPLGCPSATAFGLSPALNGGQAEYVCVPNADRTLKVTPDGVSPEQAILLTDAMATAYFGISRANVQPGDQVAVVGLGPIGLIGVELAFLLGASEVFAIDPMPGRRQRAEELGAVAFEPGAEAISTIVEQTRGGADCVFEASGASAAVEAVLPLARPRGHASFIGVPQPDVSLPLMHVLFKDVMVRAGVAPVPQLWPNLIPLLQAGRLEAGELFTHEMPLSEGAEAYRLFDSREDGVIKVMITVD